MSFCFLAYTLPLSALINNLRRWCLVIRLSMCQWGAATSRWCRGQLSCTLVPAVTLKFGSQPFRYFIRSVHTNFESELFLLVEQSIICKHWVWVTSASRHFRRCCLKTNKVSKSEQTTKDGFGTSFLKACWRWSPKLLILVSACRNYSSAKLASFWDTV